MTTMDWAGRKSDATATGKDLGGDAARYWVAYRGAIECVLGETVEAMADDACPPRLRGSDVLRSYFVAGYVDGWSMVAEAEARRSAR